MSGRHLERISESALLLQDRVRVSANRYIEFNYEATSVFTYFLTNVRPQTAPNYLHKLAIFPVSVPWLPETWAT